MSRKDYNAVADLLYKLRDNIPYFENGEFEHGYDQAVVDMANEIAEIFARDNERFETQRFLRACGV